MEDDETRRRKHVREERERGRGREREREASIRALRMQIRETSTSRRLKGSATHVGKRVFTDPEAFTAHTVAIRVSNARAHTHTGKQ